VSIGSLPALNVFLNITSAVLLTIGFIFIKKHRPDIHKRIMLSALFSSIVFLVSYLIYHYNVGSVPYLRHDWTRPLYFAILIPHVVLAGLVVPFILVALWFALNKKFDRHKKLVRFVWPVWLFVCVSGIAVYLMLYQL
jgi:putative membrane protein